MPACDDGRETSMSEKTDGRAASASEEARHNYNARLHTEVDAAVVYTRPWVDAMAAWRHSHTHRG